jgi:hypothetical protein
MILRMTITMLALSGLCAFAQAGRDRAMSLVGAWNIRVTPEPSRGTPTFDTLHVFESGGTTTNTGAFCNAVTATATGTRCSNAFGAWQRVDGRRFVYRFVVQLYNTTGQHFGFSVVQGYVELQTKDVLRGEGEVIVQFGTDLANPTSILRLGTETSVGQRISVD